MLCSSLFILLIFASIFHGQFGPIGNSTLISVRNFETIGAPNGLSIIENGHGNIPNSDYPGEFSVHFEGSGHDRTYNVLALGPEVNGLYQWSIMTDSNQQYLFVLARDYTEFKEK